MSTKKPNWVSPNNIKVYSGFLVIPGNKALGTKDTFVREQTAAEYLRFYECWRQAMSLLSPEVTFSSLWLTSGSFRAKILEALGHVGIEDPLQLRLSQLKELLITCAPPDDVGLATGLLFQLHQDFPKMAAPSPENRVNQNSPLRRKLGSLRSWCFRTLGRLSALPTVI